MRMTGLAPIRLMRPARPASLQSQRRRGNPGSGSPSLRLNSLRQTSHRWRTRRHRPGAANAGTRFRNAVRHKAQPTPRGTG